MSGLPLVLALEGQHCLCVGGGNVAARRAPILRAAGATLTVVAPSLHPDLQDLVDAGDVMHLARIYRNGDVDGSFIVLAATGDPDVDRAVAAAGLAANKLVCVASEPSLGNCEFMAGVRRGRLLVALQSGGAAPAVISALRRRIECLLPEELGQALDELAEIRGELRRRVNDAAERARRWNFAVEAGAIEMLLDGDVETGLMRTRQILLPERQEKATRAVGSDL